MDNRCRSAMASTTASPALSPCHRPKEGFDRPSKDIGTLYYTGKFAHVQLTLRCRAPCSGLPDLGLRSWALRSVADMCVYDHGHATVLVMAIYMAGEFDYR